MTTAHVPELMTVEEFMQLPDDGNLHELDEGRLVCMPPPAFKSGRVATSVSFHLMLFVRERDLGIVVSAETGVIIRRTPDTVRAADVCFIRRERVVDTGRGYFEGTPDLVVEVLSPSDRYAAVARKMSQYLAGGARLGWALDPYTRSAAVYRPGREVEELSEDGVLDGEDVLPGFRPALGDIWV